MKVLYRKNLFKLFVIILYIGIIIRIIYAIKQNNDAINEYLPVSYSITSQDSDLISKKYRDKLEIVEVSNSKVRSSISILKFNKNYHILTYKINLEKDASLDSLFIITKKSVDISTGNSYLTFAKDIIYKFRFIAGTPKPANEVYLTLAGDSLQQIIKNDSINSFYLLCDNLSIRYEMNSPIDLLINSNEKLFGRTEIIPLDVLFIKRNGYLYFLLMTPISNNAKISPDLLYKIVTGSGTLQ